MPILFPKNLEALAPYGPIVPSAAAVRNVYVLGGTDNAAGFSPVIAAGLGSIVICPDMTSIGVGTALDLASNAATGALIKFYADKIATVAGDVGFSTGGVSTNLTTISLASLTTIAATGGIDASSCPALVSAGLIIPSLRTMLGYLVLSDNGWNPGQVDAVLALLNANITGDNTGGTIDLSGSNAAPTGGALNADYLALGGPTGAVGKKIAVTITP